MSERVGQRDRAPSRFAEILRRFRVKETAIVAAVLVDEEGEAVDYSADLDPFETKILGAQWRVAYSDLVTRWRDCLLGNIEQLRVETATGSQAGTYYIKRVDHEYLLVVRLEFEDMVLQTRFNDDAFSALLDRVVGTLRDEAGVSVRPNASSMQIEPVGDRVDVENTSSDRGGQRDRISLVPGRFRLSNSVIEIEAVLGEWKHEGVFGVGPLQCYRVSRKDGAECTVAYDALLARWLLIEN